MKLFLAVLFLFLSIHYVAADVVVLDQASYPQEKINFIQAIAVDLLAKNNIKYDSIQINKDTIEVINPSGNISKILTEANIESSYQIIKSKIEQDTVEAEIEQEKKDEALDINIIKTKSIDDLDPYIDSLSNLNEVKLFLKDLTKYLKARNILE